MESLLRKLAVAVCVSLWLFASLMPSTYPIYVSGVNRNDWARYMVDSYWFSDDAHAPPSDVADINHTEWRLQIEDVLGEWVRFSIEKRLLNGTVFETREGNVRTGENMSLWIVRKNLNKGDLIYENFELKVNSTGLLEFAGAGREVVYAWYSYVEREGEVIEEHGLFWDRETGVLCGSIDKYTERVYGKTSTMVITRMNIVETSLWEPETRLDFFNNWWIALAMAIVVLVIVVAFLLRGKRRFKWRRVGRGAVSRK